MKWPSKLYFRAPGLVRRTRDLAKWRMTRDPLGAARHGFTLVESMAAVALLAFIGAGVWVVLEHCAASAADTTQRMRAFEIARENMEKVLGTDSVQESTDYGISEKFPDIRWQTTIETFSAPAGLRMWVRAVCTAEYTDTEGTPKSVELTNWLTSLSNEQMSQLSANSALQKQMLTKYVIATEELAAQYASVNIETLQQWVKNGMPMTSDGEYLKPWLDLYLQTDGKPTEKDRQDTLARYPELSITKPQKATQDQSATPDSQAQPGSNDMGSETTSDEIDPELQKQIDEMLKEQP